MSTGEGVVSTDDFDLRCMEHFEDCVPASPGESVQLDRESLNDSNGWHVVMPLYPTAMTTDEGVTPPDDFNLRCTEFFKDYVPASPGENVQLDRESLDDSNGLNVVMPPYPTAMSTGAAPPDDFDLRCMENFDDCIPASPGKSIQLDHEEDEFPDDFDGRHAVMPLVRYFRGIPFERGRRYLSDVLTIRDNDHRLQLGRWLFKAAQKYKGLLFLYVQEDDRVHVVHDCPSSSNYYCRCRWKQEYNVRRALHEQADRQRAILISALTERDLEDVLSYYLFSKRKYNPKIWMRGTLNRLPFTRYRPRASVERKAKGRKKYQRVATRL
ncbi:hypothetical protein JTE90_007067 [Oedothorax gibbosus]|uniref:Transposase MuDR plant domain-containing protein n=1 Tax=Oedothorax gibbosus TaxID=931172 RepID=A0AAV6U2P1_9ARAC|nr:hypothetical protein JTE90_007067 [Oedothorax gibbosus]